MKLFVICLRVLGITGAYVQALAARSSSDDLEDRRACAGVLAEYDFLVVALDQTVGGGVF